MNLEDGTCEFCGLITKKRSLIRHIRTRHTPFTVEEMLAWGNVDTSGGDNSCWMWNRGKKTSDAYGHFRGDRAHRQMHRAAHGEIPDGHVVCHSCDTPGCVNPKHLWVGTTSDNARDAVAKGRVISPMRDPLTRAKVAKKMPRGDTHHMKNNPELAQLRVKQMLAARGVEWPKTTA